MELPELFFFLRNWSGWGRLQSQALEYLPRRGHLLRRMP